MRRMNRPAIAKGYCSTSLFDEELQEGGGMFIVGLAAYALITLCPLLWSFTSREIIMFARETGYRKITRMKIEKCTVDIDSQMFTAFTIYQFVLCYCTPLVLIAYFYSKLLRKLREHARTFKSSHIPLMRISLYTLAVACFYFLCWTPFWMATVFAVYLENTGKSFPLEV
ncbi:hypothetical protein TELCIR_01463 [Teladorsagia circumcincta]|uniref:G-protein coupled receptors family 1 profile domain-containing protein n=1 Tax=Teladorsagia circumcincta TaxID=45464 RepID=A0A2G9V1V2_TELCI|nr:hypothetical protein TELCIR_01463 [Teladorsagia circumcincta]